MSWELSKSIGKNILAEIDKGSPNPTRYSTQLFRDFIANSVRAFDYAEIMASQHSCKNCAVKNLCKYALTEEPTRINCFAWEGDE